MPICLLLFTLPKEKFNKKNHVIIIKFGIFFGALIINILWLSYATTFLVEVNPGVNSKEQIIYILTHPISYLLILFRTIHIYNPTFILSLCGEGLGHFNSQASVLFVFPCLIIFAMLFFVNEDKNKKEFNFKEKIVYLIIFTIVLNTIAEKLDRKNFLKIQESLNTKDFSDVSLKEYDLSIIPVEEFVCTAKLDEKGNIVYTVSLNYVAQTDDYESFLRHFDIHN